MKHTALLFLLLISFTCSAQEGLLPLDAHKQVYYTDNGDLPKTKEQLYKSSQDWVRHTFGNYENAVIAQDPSAGKLVISSYIPFSHSTFDHIRFEMTIICSDNHYQATIEKLDGIAQTRSPKRFGVKENDEVIEKSIAFNTETVRKKKVEKETVLNNLKKDNDQINNAMYKLLAGLKEFVKQN